MTKPTLEERFWSKVHIGCADECWPWLASRSYEGYGRFWVPDRVRWAHRIAYELATGEPPGELQVDHLCHNPTCCNPRHLRLATPKQQREHLSGPHRNNQCGVLGVSKHGNRWRARIDHYGKRVDVGSFSSIEEAASAVRAKRLELFTHNEIDKKEPAQCQIPN